jgi:peptidylprolyl isomerase
MKLRFLAAAVAALTLSAGMAVAQDTTSEKGKLSYALGYDLGRSSADSGEALDINSIIKGLQDGFAKRDPGVPVDQLRAAVQNMQQRQTAKAKANWDKAAAENTTKSNQFLAQYRGTTGVRTLPGGAMYRVMQNGNGARPNANSTVQLQVMGPFPWGQRPQQAPPTPQTTSMKINEVELVAMREVLTNMNAGAKWEVVLPADKAYGADPRTGFPPNVAVQFEVQLVAVQ